MRQSWLAVLLAVFAIPPAAQQCDSSLWDHVYHGKFSTAQDRLKTIQNCVAVTGTVVSAAKEKDGDYHIRLKVDPQFKKLLNAKNQTAEAGFLVVEPMCTHKVTQQDTIDEGACNSFKQTIFKPSMLNKPVSVTGTYVQDQEHGWREIHPVTSIEVAQ